jgi:hypothetical protein
VAVAVAVADWMNLPGKRCEAQSVKLRHSTCKERKREREKERKRRVQEEADMRRCRCDREIVDKLVEELGSCTW